MVEPKDIEKIKEDKDALDQSLALNKITMQVLQDRAKDNKRLWIALIISIIMNLFIMGGFLYYESQWTQVPSTTTTETTTVTQDTNEGAGNNVYQAGENATYSQGTPVPTGGE